MVFLFVRPSTREGEHGVCGVVQAGEGGEGGRKSRLVFDKLEVRDLDYSVLRMQYTTWIRYTGTYQSMIVRWESPQQGVVCESNMTALLRKAALFILSRVHFLGRAK